MKGYLRGMRYWLWMLEKVLLIMIVTGVLVTVIAGGGSEEAMCGMLRMYLPMFGGIFCFAIMLSASSSYIPQSMSMGATRKEVFFSMTVSLCAILVEMILLAWLIDIFFLEGVFGIEYIMISAALYLAAAGLGNLMCAVSIKLGGRFAMIAYVIMVIVISFCGGIMGAFFGTENELGFWGILAVIKDFWYVVLIFELMMSMLCYLSIRRYEVKL